MKTDTAFHELQISRIADRDYELRRVTVHATYRDNYYTGDDPDDLDVVQIMLGDDDGQTFYQQWTIIEPKVGDALDVTINKPVDSLEDGEDTVRLVNIVYPDLTIRKLLARIEELELNYERQK